MLAKGRSRRKGQSVVEFALVAPVFFFALIAAINGGLMLFVQNSAAQGANQGMIVLADEGIKPTADADAVATISSSGLGVTSLASTDEIDIYLVCFGGAPAPQCNGIPDGKSVPKASAYYNRYDSKGNCVAGGCLWLSQNRSNSASALTNIGITVNYHFTYFGLNGTTLFLSQTRVFRLEPQIP